MSLMDMDTLAAAFRSHTEGQTKCTRHMAIVLADCPGGSCCCERPGLLKPGSRDWFVANGGISADLSRQIGTRPSLLVRWRLRRRPPSLGEWLERVRGDVVVIERRAERLLVRLSGGGSCYAKKMPFAGLG